MPNIHNYLLFIEYNGSGFSGWQKQPDKRTVQEELEKASEKVLCRPGKVSGASRTDSGVHARFQLANLFTDKLINPAKLLLALNASLPDDIAVFKVKKTGKTSKARYDARLKTYEYRVHNSASKPVLTAPFVWHVPQKLDLCSMSAASGLFKGARDFSAFSSVDAGQKDTKANIRAITIARKGKEVVITIKADRFLRHMARNISGTLVNIGKGKIETTAVRQLLAGKKGSFDRFKAPAKGLTLTKITL